jgi:hypothetical protein
MSQENTFGTKPSKTISHLRQICGEARNIFYAFLKLPKILTVYKNLWTYIF